MPSVDSNPFTNDSAACRMNLDTSRSGLAMTIVSRKDCTASMLLNCRYATSSFPMFLDCFQLAIAKGYATFRDGIRHPPPKKNKNSSHLYLARRLLFGSILSYQQGLKLEKLPSLSGPWGWYIYLYMNS